MDLCPIEFPDIKVSRGASAKNEAIRFFVANLVKKPETIHHVWRLIEFSDSTLQNLLLMDLSIVASNFLLIEDKSQRPGCGIATDAARIDIMFLR